MASWLPPLYVNSRIMDAVLQGHGADFDLVRTAIAEVLDQFFVDTATWTLDRWEAEVGVPVMPSQPASERREKIKSRIRGYGTATIRLLKLVAEAYDAGAIAVVEDYTAWTLLVRFVDTAGVPPNLSDLQNALRAVTPAHLGLLYEYRWTIWDRVDAAALTFDALDALAMTWDAWDTHF